MEQVTGLVIDREETEVLIDICSRCYFPSRSEKNNFFRLVAGSVGKQRIADITKDEYEVAFNKAISILHNLGENILFPKRTWKYYVQKNEINFDKAA